jgi:hypothetical protein
MADIPHRAKSGKDWTLAELHGYNIYVEFQDATTFFGVNTLPRPPVDEELLNNVAADDMENEKNYKLLRLAHLATSPIPSLESAVDDYAVQLLTLLGYTPRSRITRTHMEIPLTVCHHNCLATPDVCIVDLDSDEILLIIQEAKFHKEFMDPESQLIAAAIASFQANNDWRHALGQSPISGKVIPGITLTGTSPIFYKIPVTTELADSVARGVFPVERTVVHAHLPKLARPALRTSEGMKALDSRAIFLASFEAFKKFVN